MTIDNVSEITEAMDSALQPCGSVSDRTRERLTGYVALLWDWNRRINLVGAGAAADVVWDHFPDSVALAGILRAGNRVLDVGSGGGLPAIPAALLFPEASFRLVEPRAKRVAFLRTAVREIGLDNVTVLHERVEAVIGRAETADVACSLATFPVPRWLELGAKLIGPGGRLAAFSNTPVPPSWSLAPSVVHSYRRGRPPQRPSYLFELSRA